MSGAGGSTGRTGVVASGPATPLGIEVGNLVLMTRPTYEIVADVKDAWTLPSAFYHSLVEFEAAKDRIFASSWQFVTWEDQIKVPGSVYPFTLLPGCLDEPLLLSRDRDDKVRCLSNVCTHRGNLVCEGAGTVNSLRCRYHGRRFGLDGSFQSMPEFEGVSCFPGASDDLPEVESGKWRQFWFCRCAKAGQTLEAMMAEVERRVGFLPIETFRHAPDRGREYLVKGNWALYVDNYLEGFHIPYIHAALNATLDYGSYRTELFEGGNLQLGVAGDAEDCFELPMGHPDEGTRVAAYYFWLFPNLMLNFYPWGLSVNVLRPIAPDVTKVQFIPFVWREERLAYGAGADLDRVEREDEVVVELVQKGVRSRFYDRGRYSPEREKGVHQFHQMIAGRMQ